MADGLNLGRAFFSFGLEVGGLAQGITEATADVTGFVNKTTGLFGGLSRGFKAVDDTVFGVLKTSERYTRWFRDASPEIRRANEALYTYRQGQDRVAQEIKTTEERLKSQILTHQSFTNSIKLQESVIQERISREKLLQTEYEATVNKEKALIASGKATTQELSDMANKVTHAKDAWESQSQAIKVSQDQLEKMRQREIVAAEQIDVVKQRLRTLGEEQHRLNNSYDLQKDHIVSLKEREKARQLGLEQSIRSSHSLADAETKLSSVNRTLLGSINPVVVVLDHLGTVTQGVYTKVTQTSKAIVSVGVVALGTLLGTAIQGLALNTQSLVQNSLDAYAANERLTSSLKAFVAKELQAGNASLTRAQAMNQGSMRAKELLDWTQKLAVQSPFDQAGVANAFRLALAYSFTTKEAQRLTQATIDYASGTGQTTESMEVITRALGQIQAKGKLSAEEMNQLAEAGVPVREYLAKAFGVTTEKLGEMVTDGAVPAKDAILALVEAMERDFGGAAKEQANTMSGLLESLQDLTKIGLREFFTGTFQAIQPYLVKFVDTLSDPAVVASIHEIGESLGSVLGSALEFLSGTAIPALIDGFNTIVPVVQNVMATIQEIASMAYSWGSDLMQQYGGGIIDAAAYVLNAVVQIANTIAEWMEPHSPPKFLPNIDEWGKATGQLWAEGFGSASTTKAIQQIGSSLEASLHDTTQAQSALGAATKRATEATKALAREQQKLNDINKAYDAQLKPLKDKLDALTGSDSALQREKEIAQLQAIAAKRAQLGMGGGEAIQRRIDQLTIEGQIAGIEAKRDAELQAQQAVVDAASEKEKAAKEEEASRKEQLDQLKELNSKIKEQIDLQKTKDKQDAKADTEEDRRQKALTEAKLAAATSEEEKLQILQEAQSRYQEGSVEYLEYQKKINAEQQKIADQNQKNADQAAKDAKNVSDAEFEAQLATKDRAGQIQMLTEHLGTLQKGSLEYEKTLRRLNTLQREQDAADARAAKGGGKGRKKKDDSLPIAGSLYKGRGPLDQIKQDIGDIGKPIVTLGQQIKGFFDGVNKQMDGAGKRVSDFKFKVQELIRNSRLLQAVLGGVAGVLTVLVAHAIWGQIALWATRLASLVGVLGGLFTPMMALLAVAALLGAAWATNFGGIRSIVIYVWSQIEPIFEKIWSIVTGIIEAFQGGGLSAGFATLMASLPEIGKLIGQIFDKIWFGIQQFVNSDDMQYIIQGIQSILQAAWNWLLNTGIPWAVGVLQKAFVWLREKLQEWIPLAIQALGDLASQAVTWIQAKLQEWVPIVLQTLGGLASKAIAWLLAQLPGLMGGAQSAGSGIFTWVGNLVSPLFEKLKQLVMDALAWIGPNALPLLEKGLNKLVDFIIMAGNWLTQKGLPMLAGFLTTVINWLAENVPTFLNNTLPKVFAGLSYVIGELSRILLTVLQRLGIWLIGTAIPDLIRLLIFNVPPLLQALLNLVLNLLNSLVQNLPALVFWLTTTVTRLLMQLLGLISNLLVVVIANVPQYLLLFLEAVVSVVWNGLEAIGKIIWSGLIIVSNLFVTIFAAIGGIVVGFIWGMVDYGKMVVQGFWDGIKDTWPWLADLLTKWFNNFVDWIKNILGIHSPSTVFADIGNMIIQGLVNGIKALWGLLTAQGQAIWDAFVGTDGWFTKLKTGALKLWEDIKSGVTTTVTTWFSSLKTDLGNIGTFISDTWASIKKTALDAWGGKDGIITGIAGLLEGLADKVTSALSNVLDSVKSHLNKVIDLANDAIDAANKVPGVSLPHVPKLAKGAQFFMGGMAMVGENGPELAYLPRGTQVTPAGRTLDIFGRAALKVVDKVNATVSKATESIHKSAAMAGDSLVSAARQSAGRMPLHEPQVVVNDQHTAKTEEHHHWNLTVNTKATTPTVVHDFGTMKALAGATNT